MKKAIVAIAAVGVVIGLRPVVKRIGHKAREHCEQMAAQCKQMMAGQFGADDETGHKMPEHCEDTAEQFERRGEAVRAWPPRATEEADGRTTGRARRTLVRVRVPSASVGR